MYFDNKLETIEYLKSNINLKKSIDVGCMQINTKYHLKNFKDLSHLVEPEENVKYAAIIFLNFIKNINRGTKQFQDIIHQFQKKEETILKKSYLLE